MCCCSGVKLSLGVDDNSCSVANVRSGSGCIGCGSVVPSSGGGCVSVPSSSGGTVSLASSNGGTKVCGCSAKPRGLSSLKPNC